MNVIHNDTVRITKKFSFEMAHLLSAHEGLCKNIHGHSYKLYVTLKGKVKSEAGEPDEGMVMDYAELKSTVNDVILPFEHACVISKQSGIQLPANASERIIYTDFEPTCENLLVHFVHKIRRKLLHPEMLCCVKLFETESNYAEWCSTDNNNE